MVIFFSISEKYFCFIMEKISISPFLIKKYNQPIPRYTSYPTVPEWQENLNENDWEKIVRDSFAKENSNKGISLYIHLPFCESLCTYCGCNKKITTNHSVEVEYIEAIQQEWALYRRLMNERPIIRELHLGGGTPTFFSAVHLQKLLQIIFEDSIIHPSHTFSIEGHPNNTNEDQLRVLYNHGFRRISYGVQDNNAVVQKVINRIQPFENVKRATDLARKIGFTSVNFDLIYGLPFQTVESIEKTMQEVCELKPDRIAFYSYAHVPWTSKAQRLFDENDLPTAEQKIALYIKGSEMLMQNGYVDVGMDHFALPDDELCKARLTDQLHRNFMGYTTQLTGMLIGLGVSAISDVGIAYAQNDKTLHDYYKLLDQNKLPIKKGYFLNDEDVSFKKNILDISCRGHTSFDAGQNSLYEQYTFPMLQKLKTDGLIEFDYVECRVTEMGHYFIRNICSAFDLYLQRNRQQSEKKIFSSAI